MVEVGGRIRPLKPFEHGQVAADRIVTGINQEKYVIVKDLDLEQVEKDLIRLHKEKKFESVAIVLMHSFACPENELKIGEIAKKVGFTQISLSHQIMQRIKLVKRGQTCCVDAYLNPHSKVYKIIVLVYRYIQGFKQGFDDQLLERVQVFFM